MEKRRIFVELVFLYIHIDLICFSNNSFSQNQTINNFSKSKKILLKIQKITLILFTVDVLTKTKP